MLNLLPLKYKIEVKKEYLARLGFVSGVFLSLCFLIAVILLLPSYFLVNSQIKNYERQISLSEKRLSFSGAAEVISFAEDLNSKTDLFENNLKEAREISKIIGKIIFRKPKAIILESFVYDGKNSRKTKDKITVKGFSKTRGELLAFIADLKKEGNFAAVDLPASNLLKENNIEFRVVISLYGNDEKNKK